MSIHTDGSLEFSFPPRLIGMAGNPVRPFRVGLGQKSMQSKRSSRDDRAFTVGDKTLFFQRINSMPAFRVEGSAMINILMIFTEPFNLWAP